MNVNTLKEKINKYHVILVMLVCFMFVGYTGINNMHKDEVAQIQRNLDVQTRKLEAAVTQKENSESQMKELSEQVEKLTKYKQKAKKLSKENEQLKASVKKAEAENKELRAQVSDMPQQIESLNSQITDLEGEIALLESNNADLHSKVNNLESINSASNAYVETAPIGSGSGVYITNTGSKYHNAGCRYLSDSQIPISLSEAQVRGYSACKVCH